MRKSLNLEQLEPRLPLSAGDWHNLAFPTDVNNDGAVTPIDAITVINSLNEEGLLPASASLTSFVDVNHDGVLSPIDALMVVNELNSAASSVPRTSVAASFNLAESLPNALDNLLDTRDVKTLLKRASAVSPTDDAIIAVVDRAGRILGVRVEDGVDQAITKDPEKLAFAIDGAVAKARTAAFFSSNAAPLSSRTIRFISQSTVTQREVESAPNHSQAEYQGPGFVAPIGVGGRFPPEVPFTPQVDLFGIEHQSRDSQFHPGQDGVRQSSDDPETDDFALVNRFNANPKHIALGAEEFFATWPESYGTTAGTTAKSMSRGIATLPGGIPLFKVNTDSDGNLPRQKIDSLPAEEQLPVANLVGGIGVFFPGPDGFATHEQGFVQGAGQTELQRNNADRVLESEFIALVAAAGGGLFHPNPNSSFLRDLSEFNTDLPSLPDFVLPIGRIDLVGITLEIYGPNPTTASPIPGIDKLIDVGRELGRGGMQSGSNVRITPEGLKVRSGHPVPEGWLVAPHDAPDKSITAEEVEQIIQNGIKQADKTRAAIRLDPTDFSPGPRTRMVLAVADKSGNLLGLHRMPDATIFSIDVSVAKARNTGYYADAEDLQPSDRIDFDGDGTFEPVVQGLTATNGDTVPLGTALTNRTFRFLVEPRYPTGVELNTPRNQTIVNDLDPHKGLCEQAVGLCLQIGPQSMLRLPGINPLTAENLDVPLEVDVYAGVDRATGKLLDSPSVLAFDAFNISRNFRDPGDYDVVIFGSSDGTGMPIRQPLANQNGVVFFPGSAPLYTNHALVGGFGVSGDGVDQDDVVTAFGLAGFEAPEALRVDQFLVAGVRLPYLKFNRNPEGA